MIRPDLESSIFYGACVGGFLAGLAYAVVATVWQFVTRGESDLD